MKQRKKKLNKWEKNMETVKVSLTYLLLVRFCWWRRWRRNAWKSAGVRERAKKIVDKVESISCLGWAAFSWTRRLVSLPTMKIYFILLNFSHDCLLYCCSSCLHCQQEVEKQEGLLLFFIEDPPFLTTFSGLGHFQAPITAAPLGYCFLLSQLLFQSFSIFFWLESTYSEINIESII